MTFLPDLHPVFIELRQEGKPLVACVLPISRAVVLRDYYTNGPAKKFNIDFKVFEFLDTQLYQEAKKLLKGEGWIA